MSRRKRNKEQKKKKKYSNYTPSSLQHKSILSPYYQWSKTDAEEINEIAKEQFGGTIFRASERSISN